MKWVKDRTGRFAERPFWLDTELEAEAQRVVADFRQATRRSATYPLTTDDLTVLIERKATELDLYADLTGEGPDVEGLTEFFPDGSIRVRIEKRLSGDPRRQNRLRTTLTHEYGHIDLHAFLAGLAQTVSMFDEPVREAIACRRDRIVDAPTVDWMEWQASHMSGALLMPADSLVETVRGVLDAAGAMATPALGTPLADSLVEVVAVHYSVSEDAARVRLAKRGLLGAQPVSQAVLFGS